MTSRYNIDFCESKFISRKDVVNGNKFFIIRGLSLKDINQAQDNTIYLDGSFKGPLFNIASKIYSLDHHENCVRQITKSTCEQALLFSKSKVFENTKLNVIGNDPDLDTILAGWILLNIDEIQTLEVFRKLLPLILVAGNIDSYGFGYEYFTGLSHEIISQEINRLEWLRSDEVKLKKEDRWKTINFVDYVLSIFDKLDRYIFFKPNELISKVTIVKKLISLKNKKEVCFIENNELGIYDAEKLLKDNTETVCIILSNGSGKYTVKLTNLINDFSLENVWLNLSNAEMLAKNTAGLNATNNPQLFFTNWGGSSNIGGSPRYFDGSSSFLNSEQIIQSVVYELDTQVMENDKR